MFSQRMLYDKEVYTKKLALAFSVSEDWSRMDPC